MADLFAENFRNFAIVLMNAGFSGCGAAWLACPDRVGKVVSSKWPMFFISEFGVWRSLVSVSRRSREGREFKVANVLYIGIRGVAQPG